MLFLEGRVENRGGRGLKMEGGGGGRNSRARSEGADFCPKNGSPFFLKRSKQFFFERERSVLF